MQGSAQRSFQLLAAAIALGACQKRPPPSGLFPVVSTVEGEAAQLSYLLIADHKFGAFKVGAATMDSCMAELQRGDPNGTCVYAIDTCSTLIIRADDRVDLYFGPAEQCPTPELLRSVPRE